MDDIQQVKKRYDRNSRYFDLFEAPMERMFLSTLRKSLFERVNAGKHADILEVGVGTGKNLPYYNGQHVTGIDISDKMLESAHRKARRLSKLIELRVADVQALPFADNTFDAALTTFVFCSVPEPDKGLAEMRRVVKPDGAVYFLEHVRPTESRLMAFLFDLIDPVISRITGAHVNRETLAAIRRAGFRIVSKIEQPGGIVKMVKAIPNKGTGAGLPGRRDREGRNR